MHPRKKPAANNYRQSAPPILAVLAIFVTALGLGVAHHTALSNPSEWGKSVVMAYWLLLISAILSLILTGLSLYLRATWYGALLLTGSAIYAGILSVIALLAWSS